MIRFPDFIKNDSLLKGILQVNYGYKNAKIDNIIFPTQKHINRAFDGDIVYYKLNDNNIGQVYNIERNNYNIVGVLQITSLTTYGVNKKGSHFYMFKPDNRKLPSFYVAFDKRKKTNKLYSDKGKNIYCSIKFEFWKNTSKCPRGSIIKIIGTIGELQAEYNYILSKYQLDYKKHNIKKIDIEKIDSNSEYNKELDIISIDPEGCIDIDDALHYLKLNNNCYEIGIHIADVTYYLDKLPLIDELASKRCSTIYTPNERNDMIPSFISTKVCSLRPKELKRVVSLICKFDRNDNLLEYNFLRQIIKSKKAYTYNKVDDLLDKKNNKYNLLNLMEKAEKIEKKFGFNLASEKSHKLVEVFMVFANMISAKYLIENKKNPLIRTHTFKSCYDINKINNIKDNSLKHYLYILNMNRANYVIYEKNINTFHKGLNISYYTHFTSPIRRYADIIVHRQILNNDNYNDLIDKCKIINDVNYRTRQAQRDFDKLQIIKLLEENPFNNLYNAFVTEFRGKNINIYIKEFKLGLNFRPYNRKLDNILEYDIDDTSMKITNKQTNNSIKINLLDEIIIKLVPYMNEETLYKKLVIRLENNLLN